MKIIYKQQIKVSIRNTRLIFQNTNADAVKNKNYADSK